ncbi:MAG: hypothetical protein GY909_01410 [Oligoflexia bacterium]|nr:hypothetical protein [Oligoflexia bacterium]
MGVNKLDIEFEDDDEIKAREEAERKKNELVEDVEIDFGASPESQESSESSEPKAQEKPKVKVKPEAKAAEPTPTQSAQPTPAPAQPSQSPAPQPSVSQPTPQPVAAQAQPTQVEQVSPGQIMVGPDYKLGDELKKAMMTNQILAIEMEARVQVEATKMSTDIIAKHAADAKLLEHKVNKLISAVAAKAPALKKELLQIKKLVGEHARIGEEEESPVASATKSQSGSAKPSGPKPAAPRPVKKKAA